MTMTSPILTNSMNSPNPGSELSHARTFLRARQAELQMTREHCTAGARRGDAFRRLDVWNAEKRVLAALSWVWDAQERAREEGERPFFEYVSARIQETTDKFLDRMAKHLMPKKRRRARAKAA